MRAQPQQLGRDAELGVPAQPLGAPELVPLRCVVGRHEELELHLLELTGAKDEVAGCDLVAEGLADLGDAERRLLARGLQDVGEVDEHALRRLGAQVGHGRLRPRPGPAWVLNIRLKARAGVNSQHLEVTRAVTLVELILTEPPVADRAVDERVGEVLKVAARLPDRWRREDRGVDEHDVVALLHHRPHPGVLHVAQHQRAERAVVVSRAESAVDLGRRENEAPSLAQVDDLIEIGCGHEGRGYRQVSALRLAKPLADRRSSPGCGCAARQRDRRARARR